MTAGGQPDKAWPNPSLDHDGTVADFRHACPQCGLRFDEYATTCPRCRADLDDLFSVTYQVHASRGVRIIAWVAVMGLVALIAATVATLVGR